MASLATLKAFAETIEANDHVGAIEQFYAPAASIRENDNPPLHGREALAERKRQVLTRVGGVKTARLGPVLLDQDHTAIRRRFEFMGKNGSTRVMEEVAWQTWRDKELIDEHFL
jgi:hypothetical protein